MISRNLFAGGHSRLVNLCLVLQNSMHRSRYAHCTNGLCFVEDRGADARHTGFILFVIHRVSNLSYSLEFFAHPLPRTARQLGQVEEIWRPRIVSKVKSKHRFTYPRSASV